MKRFIKLLLLCGATLYNTNYIDAKIDFNCSYSFNKKELENEKKLIEVACDEWIASKKMYYAEKQTNEGGWVKGCVHDGQYVDYETSFKNIGSIIKLKLTQPNMEYDFSKIDLDKDINAAFKLGYWMQNFVALTINEIKEVALYDGSKLGDIKKNVLNSFYNNKELNKCKNILRNARLYIDTLDIFNMIATVMRVSVILKNMPEYEREHKRDVKIIPFNNGNNNCYLTSFLQIVNALNRAQIGDKGLERVYDIIQDYWNTNKTQRTIDPRGIFAKEYLKEREKFDKAIDKIRENYKNTEIAKTLGETQVLTPLFVTDKNTNTYIINSISEQNAETGKIAVIEKICEELLNDDVNYAKIISTYLKIRKINRDIINGYQSIGETFFDIKEYFGIQTDKMTKFVNGYWRKTLNDNWQQITEKDFRNKIIIEISNYSVNDVFDNIQSMITTSSCASFKEALRDQVCANKMGRMDALLDKIFDGNLWKPYCKLSEEPKDKDVEKAQLLKISKDVKTKFASLLQEAIGKDVVTKDDKVMDEIKRILSTEVKKSSYTLSINCDELFEKIGNEESGAELLGNIKEYGFTTKSSATVNSELDCYFFTKIVEYPKVIIKNIENITYEIKEKSKDIVYNKDYLYTITLEGKILVYRLVGFANRRPGHYNASIFDGIGWISVDSSEYKTGKKGKNTDKSFQPDFYVYQQIYDERNN